MLESLFDKNNQVNIGRQLEADVAKTICMIGMMLVHCFEIMTPELGGGDGLYFIMVIVVDALFCATIFMFCMGMGISYSNGNPVKNIKRGISIFILGYILNAIRGGFTLLVLYAVSGKENCIRGVPEEFLNLDILHFAGLALILFGLIRLMKHYHIWLSIIAILMSVIGSFVREIDTGDFYLNQFMGLQ